MKLLMRKGADPGMRNLENELPCQLVPEGSVGEKVKRLKGSPNLSLFSDTTQTLSQSKKRLFRLIIFVVCRNILCMLRTDQKRTLSVINVWLYLSK